MKASRFSDAQKAFIIEAMKMETAVYAETGGTVIEVLIDPGHRVETHDLIVVMAPDD